MIHRHYSLLLKMLFFNIVLVLVSLVKVNFILGSFHTFFSASQIVGPLVGFYGGLSCITVLYVLKDVAKVIFFGTGLFSPLTLHIPTFFSAAYWASSSVIFRLVVPLMCIVLFLIHPVGNQAAFYTLYWLLPLVIYFVSPRSIFLHALASTFIAHAVGSVIWLYWLPLKSELFLALMPVVLVERLLFASGMTLTYYVIEYAKWFRPSTPVQLIKFVQGRSRLRMKLRRARQGD